jgi:hypothetical protein
MRSGSSLLTHILASNPEILGYGESMTRYSAPRDFDLLALKTSFMLRRFPLRKPERYLLDKLLHNVLLAPADMEMLISHQVRLIFLLRSPAESLASIVRSLSYTEEQAIQYYVDRLDILRQYAQCIPRGYPAAALTYRQLVYETDSVSGLLRSVLDLRVPLSEQYKLLPTTGQRGIGDFSANIKAGRVLRRRSSGDATEVTKITAFKHAQDVYRATYTEIFSHCETV